MADLIMAIPPNVFLWLVPFMFIVIIIFSELRNKMLTNSIEKLDKTVEKLSNLLDKQDKTLDEITQRLIRVEVELDTLKHRERGSNA
jgi:hypothetical protein